MQYVLELARQARVGWSDLFDIAIVSVAIYEFFKLIRGTRTAQMVLGSGVIVALYFVSRWASLETLNWLIRNMVGYVVFAAIVVFQSDIRRALAHFGQAPFFRYFARSESAEETIEEIVVASTMLAGQRVGAILVVEREPEAPSSGVA